jgi:anti-sigma factor RsiW
MNHQLCPDNQLISVYLDGELPSPWKEKLEDHLAGCRACRERLETYRAFFVEPAQEEAAGAAAAQERVWQKLEQHTGIKPRSYSLWRRRISVPIPAVAAAAAVIIFIAFAVVWAARTPGTAETPGMALIFDDDFETPGIIPVSDMGEVLQYLGARDSDEVLIIRLPESRNFFSYGEPAIIRAADYSRQTAGRQTQGRRRP